MAPILMQGSTWPLDDLSEEQRLSDVLEAIKFGNHKGAESNPEAILKLVSKDVKHGYAVAFPLSKAHLIPGILIAPMNIMHQNTIDESGRIIEKDRLTHDQSYMFSSGTSVNSRVRTDELLPCMYGACLRRILNWACAARAKYPGIGIYATKVDYKLAYRRCHANAATALQSCTRLAVKDEEELLIIILRLTFGGKACPSEWSALAEPQCDLSNALLHDDEWDPATLASPSQHLVKSPNRNADINRPFGIGKELAVDIPINERGIYDLYLDDIIGLSLDMPGTNNLERSAGAHLLAIAATARPSHDNEPIPREAMEAEAKLAAEASPEEIKLILGWLMDFRELTVSLPDNKYIAWSADIVKMLTSGSAKAKELETLIGRLGHLGMVIPFVYHFLSRLREWHHKSRHKRFPSQMTAECRQDLMLMRKFLDRAHNGIDMNLISYRRPTHVYRSDSCPFGLGGYSNEGFAWRFELPSDLRFRASNFMASIISPWVDIIAERLSRGDCALSMTDSTTSAGWIRKTNFKEDALDPIEATTRIEIARHHACLFIEKDIKEYSQWFEGKRNPVADALSREFERDDTELTNILRSLFPSQLPQHFEIVSLPTEISSWLTSSLQKLPVKEQLREAHTRAKLDPGVGSNSTQNQSGLDMMSTSNLDSFTKSQRNRIMGAFAMAMRQARFSGPSYHRLAEGTIRNTISDVCSTFRENGRPNPTKDDDMQLSFILQRLFRAFRNEDPNEKQQKAVPPNVILAIAQLVYTEEQRAIGQLSRIGFFFAMRSREYLKVPRAEQGRTKLLLLRNIRFVRDGKNVSHDDPTLELSDCIAITFEMQKKEEKNDTVHHKASGDMIMCPVRSAAELVRRIRGYPGTDGNTPISAILVGSNVTQIKSKQMVGYLRDAVQTIGEDALNIKAEEVGTHSIRSGAAMAMFLGGLPVYLIMLMGRWSSDAFLRYIRKQIEQFSHDVSSKMIENMCYRYIPAPTESTTDRDPRQRNNPDNAETRRNVGGNATRQARLPAFSQFI
jgi:hypothetical protein